MACGRNVSGILHGQRTLESHRLSQGAGQSFGGKQEKEKRILLDDHERIRLAAKAKRLTRKLLEETTVLFTPETVPGWYRRLIAQKYDGSKSRKHPGRPRISQEIIDLVIRLKKENPHWGYTRIRDYIVHLGYTVSETTVKPGFPK